MARIRTIKPNLDALEAFEFRFAPHQLSAKFRSVVLAPCGNDAQRPLEHGDLRMFGGMERGGFQARHKHIQPAPAGQLPIHGIVRGASVNASPENTLDLLKDRRVNSIEADPGAWGVAGCCSSNAIEGREVKAPFSPKETAELCQPNRVIYHTYHHTAKGD